jgi:hypothetical protein
MTSIRRLPRSLDPLPDESLPGYLLRLSHRLELSPLRLGRATGLALPNAGIPAGCMLALRPDTIERFARATRLSTAETTSLTLASLSSRYPPVNTGFSFSGQRKQQRNVEGVFVKENWILSRSSRYCPQCLAGDGSPIQSRYGGVWSRFWRLPVVFACPTHGRLLEHACPACQQPALQRGVGEALLPLQAHNVLHPTHCRSPVIEAGRTRLCDHALALPAHEPAPATPGAETCALLVLQDRLLGLLRHDCSTSSFGQPATSAQYFIDLRVLACLITASWPAARHVLEDPRHAELVDRHIQDVRAEIDRIRHSSRRSRDLALYDKPPLASATCAALLAVADAITRAADPEHGRQILLPLLDHTPSRGRHWVRQFLPGNGYCSPGLYTALGPEVGAKHVIARTGIQPFAVQHRQPPPRPVRFGPEHIPQRIPAAWINDYFTEFGDLNPRQLHLVVAARLAQMSLGGPIALAAIPLRIPQGAVHRALHLVDKNLHETSRRGLFDRAVVTLADHLNNIDVLVDYGKRRHALAGWSIPAADWSGLAHGLPDAHYIYGEWRRIAWDEPKRVLSSIWVWHTATHGDHIYAPPLGRDPQAQHSRREAGRYLLGRWPHICHGTGIYQQLRERLTSYAEGLVTEIDHR